MEKQSLRAKRGALLGGGHGSLGCHLLMGGSIWEGVCESLLFASISLQYPEGKEKGAGNISLLSGSGNCPGSTWWAPGKGYSASPFLVFPWVSVWEGTPGPTDPGSVPGHLVLSHLQLKPTPCFPWPAHAPLQSLGVLLLWRARKGVSLMRWVLQSAQREGGCDPFAIGGCLRGEVHQPSTFAAWCLLLSECFCDAGVVPLNNLPWENSNRLKSWKWMGAYLLPGSAWTVCLQTDGESGLQVLWCMWKSSSKFLNSTIYLQWW